MFTLLLCLFLLAGILTSSVFSKEDSLLFNPNLEHIVRLAGEDNSFFISCIPSIFESPSAGSEHRNQIEGLQWQKLHQSSEGNIWIALGSEQHSRVHVEQSPDGRGLDLVFRSIISGDRGEYACQATIHNKEIKRTFNLNVIEPISFEGTQEHVQAEEGNESFTIECLVSGNPKPEISWNVRGEIIRGGASKYKVIPSGLRIQNISRSDEGTYKCKATQSEGGVTDFQDIVIYLKVQHKPEWPSSQRGEFYGFISGSTNLTCEANAEPPAEFTWHDKYDQPIQHGRIMNEAQKSTLEVTIEHDEYFGDYICIAKNKIGTLRKVVTLAEGAKPGIPQIQIDRINYNSAEMTIQEPKGELFLHIIGFIVEYKTKDEDWSNATTIFINKNDSQKYTIDNLLPKTFYHVRAQAQNWAGFSDHSNMIYLQTSDKHSVRQLVGNHINHSQQLTPVIFLFIFVSLLLQSF